MNDTEVIAQSQELVEQLRPPPEFLDFMFEYAQAALDASMKLFTIHPASIIIIGGLIFAIRFLLMPRFKFIPKILDYPVSFMLAIAIYPIVFPFIFPFISGFF